MKNWPYILVMALCVVGVVITKACENYWSDGTPNLYKVSDVEPGRHDFDFGQKVTTCRAMRVHVRIPSKSVYHIPSVDSYDYNKGPGYMYGFDNHRHVCMLGWRIINRTVEASYYIHPADKSMVFLAKGHTVNFQLDEWWYYEVHDRVDHWYFLFSNGQDFTYPKDQNIGPPYRINGWWFGGTSPAPSRVEVHWYIERCIE